MTKLKSIGSWCTLLLVIISAFALWYYLDGREYLAGKEHHFVGTSIISPSDFVSLADTESAFPLFAISEIAPLENGLVEITYDFFSIEDYPLLTVEPISYFDSPLLNTLYEARQGFYVLGGGILLLVLIKIILPKIKDGDRKAYNAAWYMIHPKYLFYRKTSPQIYTPIIETEININHPDAGIYAARTWKYKNGYLYSAGIGQARWENKSLLAEKPLAENNEIGIYSCRLGVVDSESEFMKNIIGIVSLSGEWFEHADGVLRSQGCEIIFLIVSCYHKAVASILSSTYGVPIIVVDNPINAYMNWLFTDNGTSCLQHNAKILKGGIHGNKRKSYSKGQATFETSSTDFGS